jgi:hypothetical protein
MKLYLAARFGRREEIVNDVLPILELDGHSITSRWLWADDDGGEKAAHSCMQDIDRAEGFVLFTDPAGSMNTGGGRWFEFGYAYRRMQLIFAVGDRETVFCHLPTIIRCQDIEDLRQALNVKRKWWEGIRAFPPHAQD